jgi:hypothetical protein
VVLLLLWHDREVLEFKCVLLLLWHEVSGCELAAFMI